MAESVTDAGDTTIARVLSSSLPPSCSSEVLQYVSNEPGLVFFHLLIVVVVNNLVSFWFIIIIIIIIVWWII